MKLDGVRKGGERVLHVLTVLPKQNLSNSKQSRQQIFPDGKMNDDCWGHDRFEEKGHDRHLRNISNEMSNILPLKKEKLHKYDYKKKNGVSGQYGRASQLNRDDIILTDSSWTRPNHHIVDLETSSGIENYPKL